MDLNTFLARYVEQKHVKGAPVGLGPHSPLLTDPWPYQASRAASELPPETTPHPTRLCVAAGCDPSLPPHPLLPPLLPLRTHRPFTLLEIS